MPRRVVLVVSMCLGAAGGHTRSPLADTQRPSHAVSTAGVCVVTDVDDTLKSSGGLSLFGIPLGGVDTSFARGSFYPGAFQFGLELSAHGVEGHAAQDIAILTARAQELIWFLEITPDSPICSGYTAAAARNPKLVGADWGVGDVLYGSVQEWICQERKAWRKMHNFELLCARREASGSTPAAYVFVGDNGWSERDEEAVDAIAKTGRLRAAFIHAVSDDRDQPVALPSDRTTAEGVPVYYFRTYVGAALKAYHGDLLEVGAVGRIVESAEAEARDDPRNMREGSLNEEILWMDVEDARYLLVPN